MSRENQLVDLIRHSDALHIDQCLDDAPTALNVKDPMGLLPLHHCVITGHNDIAEKLIAKGAEPDIFSACGLGFINQIENMIRSDPSLRTRPDNLGLTPLHWAALGGQAKVAEMLLGYGADINARDKTGATPLHCAAKNGHRELAELFLYDGADRTATDNNYVWPALSAVREGHHELAELLRCELDEIMSARFSLAASAFLCAIEVIAATVFLCRIYPRTDIISSPYMFIVALSLFAVAWIGFSAAIYARLSVRRRLLRTTLGAPVPSFIMVIGAIVSLTATVAGLLSLLIGLVALLR